MDRGGERMLSRWSGVFQIAAVYVGTVVGAGFATGKEIVEFFTQYGFYGFFGILIAGYLFIFTGTKLMLVATRINATSYEEFNEYLFGKKAAFIINLFFMLMLLGVSAVMISGAGAVFEEQLGMSKRFGVWLTVVLATIVLVFGTRGLFAINSFVVPIMISFSLILCFLTIGEGNFIDSLLKIPDTGVTWKIFFSPFSYTALNLALAQAVLVPIAYEVQDKQIIKRGGILGGIFLTIILLSGHIALMTLPDVVNYEIPAAIIMKSVAETLYWVFIFVIYGEIFTSVIGNIFGLERQIGKFWKVPSVFIILFLFMLAIMISEIGYGRLLSYLYPLFGYISLIFLVLVWRSKID